MVEKKASSLDEFKSFRQKMNDKIHSSGTLTTRRFFTLDGKAYEAGALSEKTKELLGLAASMVLRCDDCITYHIIQAVLSGASDEELWETFDIALIVGGSIVVPHLRRAVSRLEECRELEQTDPQSLQLQAEKPDDTH
ncbi:MAG: carboxymuconolactone decarboxylase family protein [Candidatus Kariarchaeaceae archaeon]|jgi:AhpD family alkylhydroperoxidase